MSRQIASFSNNRCNLFGSYIQMKLNNKQNLSRIFPVWERNAFESFTFISRNIFLSFLAMKFTFNVWSIPKCSVSAIWNCKTNWTTLELCYLLNNYSNCWREWLHIESEDSSQRLSRQAMGHLRRRWKLLASYDQRPRNISMSKQNLFNVLINKVWKLKRATCAPVLQSRRFFMWTSENFGAPWQENSWLKKFNSKS